MFKNAIINKVAQEVRISMIMTFHAFKMLSAIAVIDYVFQLGIFFK